MKHIKKFEELDYRELLAQQSKLRQDMEKLRQEEIEKNRKELSGKRLSEISAEVEKSKQNSDALKDRQEITHTVVQSLIYSEMNKDGFENFKDDLKNFLNNYPLETLPKSGTSIYR